MARGKVKRKRQLLHEPPGSSPGTLLIDPLAPKPILNLMSYHQDNLFEEQVSKSEKIAECMQRKGVFWLDIDGLGDEALLRQIASLFSLHRLALEDAVNANQRPKVEHYDSYVFIVLRMMKANERLDTEQISLFLGKNYVLSFQEGQPWDCLEPVRQRIRKSVGRIRSQGPDYLAYAILDAIIDAYFPVLEIYGERLEQLEDSILSAPSEELAARIHEIKRDLLTMRRSIWPLRDAIASLLREPGALIRQENLPYFRDCYDHIVQIVDLIETYRELGSGLMDVYLSSMSNKMNEVMKVLTVISTIFMPLTFVAGIYGMNFDPKISGWNMPELEWRFGYIFSLILMSAIAFSLLVFFNRKGWLGRKIWVPPKKEKLENNS